MNTETLRKPSLRRGCLTTQLFRNKQKTASHRKRFPLVTVAVAGVVTGLDGSIPEGALYNWLTGTGLTGTVENKEP